MSWASVGLGVGAELGRSVAGGLASNEGLPATTGADGARRGIDESGVVGTSVGGGADRAASSVAAVTALGAAVAATAVAAVDALPGGRIAPRSSGRTGAAADAVSFGPRFASA